MTVRNEEDFASTTSASTADTSVCIRAQQSSKRLHFGFTRSLVLKADAGTRSYLRQAN